MDAPYMAPINDKKLIRGFMLSSSYAPHTFEWMD